MYRWWLARSQLFRALLCGCLLIIAAFVTYGVDRDDTGGSESLRYVLVLIPSALAAAIAIQLYLERLPPSPKVRRRGGDDHDPGPR